MAKYGEPLKLFTNVDCGFGILIDENGKDIGELYSREMAERAVACINALEGKRPGELQNLIDELNCICKRLQYASNHDTESRDRYSKSDAANDILYLLSNLEDKPS